MSSVQTIEYNTGVAAQIQISSKWWTQEGKDVYRHVVSVVDAIKQNQNYRSLDNIRYARLYANKDISSLVANTVSEYFGHKLTLNVIRSCIDTAAAKIASEKPRPLFLSSGGDYSLQNKAKKLSKYVYGRFKELDVYRQGQRCFVDSCVFGTGVYKVYKENNQIKGERIFPEELIVDDIEGRDGNPRQKHQEKYVHREVLLELFPEFQDEIKELPPYVKNKNSYRTAADVVRVVESWHLPSSPGAKDGRHTICIQNATLFDEEWKKPYFPFVVLRWSPSLLGYYGDGLAAELIGIQLEINLLLLRIKQSQELVAVPRVFIENGSQVITSHITDEVGGVVRYTGTPPVFNTAQAQNREIYEYLEYLYNKSFAISGISQLSATSKKPAGLDSSVALREYQDIETERFSLVAERYQDFYLQIAKLIVDLSRDIYDEDKNLSVNLDVPGKKFIETIKWKDVNLEDDQYLLQLYPTSLLPKTPEGQLQRVQELIQSGFMDRDEALSLLDFPDLEGFFSLKNAAMDDVKMIIEQILDKGEYQPPDPVMDLQMAIKMMQSAYLRGKVNKVPTEHLDLALQFIEEATALLIPEAPPQRQNATVNAPPGGAALPGAPTPPLNNLPLNGLPQ